MEAVMQWAMLFVGLAVLFWGIMAIIAGSVWPTGIVCGMNYCPDGTCRCDLCPVCRWRADQDAPVAPTCLACREQIPVVLLTRTYDMDICWDHSRQADRIARLEHEMDRG